MANKAGGSNDEEGDGGGTPGGSGVKKQKLNFITKLKVATGHAPPPPTTEKNPITKFFTLEQQIGSAGPDYAWRIYKAIRKSDREEFAVFMFDKRLTERIFRSKRSEAMIARVRQAVINLEKWRHPRILQVVHRIEEGPHTIAFASEPVLSSLYNILNWHDSLPIAPDSTLPVMPNPVSLNPPTGQPTGQPTTPTPGRRVPFAKEYTFSDIEVRYGFQQILDGLHYMHSTSRRLHRNICPENIIVTQKATWKIFGFEFVENLLHEDPAEMVDVHPWSVKTPKIFQPNLDYLAPEVQLTAKCGIRSDMFSLGLTMITVFNRGKPLIQAQGNPILYLKQIKLLDTLTPLVCSRLTGPLQEALLGLTKRDTHPRPATGYMPLVSSTKDSVVEALQYMDSTIYKEPNFKSTFYGRRLVELLPHIPVKLRWMNVWPALQAELFSGDCIPSVLISVMWVVEEATEEEFVHEVLGTIVAFLELPKSVQSLCILMEHFVTIVKKTPPEARREHLVPFLIRNLESYNGHVQASTILSIYEVQNDFDDTQMRSIILPRVKDILSGNPTDGRAINLILEFYEKRMPIMEREHLLDHMIPAIFCMSLKDPKILHRVTNLFKSTLENKKDSINATVMATKMLPPLIPQTVNPDLNVNQFTALIEIIIEMLDNIDTERRQHLKVEKTVSVAQRYRAFRRASNDVSDPPPFNIPNLRVDRRKTSSAEDMGRRPSLRPGPSTSAAATAGGSGQYFATTSGAATAAEASAAGGYGSEDPSASGGFRSSGFGKWFFGSNNSTNNDNNFLRVGNILPNRRLSDNALLTPKIRIAPSCASSPGGTPGGSNSNLPTRRHSSIGPQERRGSAVNLSPPTGPQARGKGGSGSSLSVPATSQYVGGSMPNTSSSVPYLLTSSMQSIRSRRPSTATGGSRGSGLLHQISSGMVRHLPAGSQPSVQVTQPRLSNWTAAGYNAIAQHTAMAVRKCPSLNISITK